MVSVRMCLGTTLHAWSSADPSASHPQKLCNVFCKDIVTFRNLFEIGFMISKRFISYQCLRGGAGGCDSFARAAPGNRTRYDEWERKKSGGHIMDLPGDRLSDN